MTVGSRVLSDWNLPPLIAQVALEHHEGASAKGNVALGIVMLADALGHAAEDDLETFDPATPTRPGAAPAPDPRSIGVDEQKLAETYEYARELWATLVL